MKEIKLLVPEEQAKEFGEKVKELLADFDIEDDNEGALDALLPITERVKTFEDALRVLGTPEEQISDDYFKEYEKLGEDVVAYLKLRVIAEALNEGWKPKFTKDEYRYYPWFYLYTQAEIDKMSEEERSKLLVVGGYAHYFAQCGVSYSVSNNAFSISYTIIGARLAFKTSELAKYAGTQFLSIWSAYVFKPIKKEENHEPKQ